MLKQFYTQFTMLMTQGFSTKNEVRRPLSLGFSGSFASVLPVPRIQAVLFSLAVVVLAGCSGGFRYLDAPPLEFKDLDYGFETHMTTGDPGIAYIDQGSGEQTLILVHGLASNAGFWRYVIPSLSEHYRVIAVDLPGYGKSSKGDYPYGMRWYADQLVVLMDELGLQQATLVGHSMGGQISMHASLRHPDRVQSLVLAAPAGIEPFGRGAGDWLSSVITMQGVMNTPEDAIRRNLSGNFYRFNSRWEWMVEERTRMAKAEEMHEFAYAVDRSVDAMLDEPTTPLLGDISVPTLIVYGKYDGLIPNPYLNPGRASDVFRAGQQAIRGSVLVEIDRAGHMLQIEQPEAFVNAVIGYLRGM
ncbi:MAG: alpha/beta hydrolase [Bacteroidetes bacterium]|nr:alpha/beta hydrolase [Bacteroidota bacterium]MCH8523917.1 alpha/beta hydrolase [Balneolales bacterium]